MHVFYSKAGIFIFFYRLCFPQFSASYHVQTPTSLKRSVSLLNSQVATQSFTPDIMK